MGDELGSATGIDRLLVSSGLSTPIFTLIKNDDFGAVMQILGQNCRQKLVIFSFFGYLGEIVSDFPNCVDLCICTIVPRSVLPIFKSQFAVVDELRLQEAFIRFLAGTARIIRNTTSNTPPWDEFPSELSPKQGERATKTVASANHRIELFPRIRETHRCRSAFCVLPLSSIKISLEILPGRW